MMRSIFVVLVLLVAPPVAVANLWGRCDNWRRSMPGCSMTSGHTCSSHLSAGPQDATFEIVLGDLPASTATDPVHLQWFAAHEAIGFDPKNNNYNDWIIHSRPSVAYPLFGTSEFNGGNVRVNETGHATLRFKAPSTYYICRRRVRYPHIHLRLCTGQNYLVSRSETIDFGFNRVAVRACGSRGRYTIRSFTKIRPIPTSASTTAVAATSTTVDATTLRRTTTSGTTMHSSTTELVATTLHSTTTTGTTTGSVMHSSTAALATTLHSTTTTGTTTGSVVQLLTATADDSFDWDALEFSPVYQCILENKLYNYFSTSNTSCVDSCPSHADAKHSQCVRKSTGNVVHFNVSWSLQVRCDQACWNAKTSRSRHNLRLAIADQLDITFQEVEKVLLRPGSLSLRRLSTVPISSASLLVTVTTDRVALQTGRDLLKTFLPNIQAASVILGLDVHGMQADTGAAPPNGQLQPGEEKDEFIPIYNEAAAGNSNKSPAFGSSPSDGLPLELIIGGIAAILVLGTLIVASVWYIRRMRRNFAKDMAAVKGKEVEVNDVEGENNGAPEDAKASKPGEDELVNPSHVEGNEWI